MAILCLIILVISLWFISSSGKPLYKVIDDFTNEHMWLSIIITLIYVVISIFLINFNHYITATSITFFLVATFINIISHEAPFINKIQLFYSAFSAYSLAKGLFTKESNGKFDGTIFIVVSLFALIVTVVYSINKDDDITVKEYKKGGDKMDIKNHSWLYYMFKPLVYGSEDQQHKRRLKNITKARINEAIDSGLGITENSSSSNTSVSNLNLSSAIDNYTSSLFNGKASYLNSITFSSTSSSNVSSASGPSSASYVNSPSRASSTSNNPHTKG